MLHADDSPVIVSDVVKSEYLPPNPPVKTYCIGLVVVIILVVVYYEMMNL